tara:strand:+ start:838 stop:1074 length:237 start_codon:yes stop_codon:yes gene_type:complete
MANQSKMALYDCRYEGHHFDSPFYSINKVSRGKKIEITLSIKQIKALLDGEMVMCSGKTMRLNIDTNTIVLRQGQHYN